jgi:hypothetical protein
MGFIRSIKSRVKEFWTENEQKVVFLMGFVLVAVIAFQFGALQGKKWQQKPVIIEKTATQEACQNTPVNVATDPQKTALSANLEPKKDCAFMGSKNSNKYHLPSCQWAKRIKPENVVCFKSVEDATSKNYQPDKGCIK